MSEVKIIEQPAGFKPITLSITLTSQEELEAFQLLTFRDHEVLAACLNASSSPSRVDCKVLHEVIKPIRIALRGL